MTRSAPYRVWLWTLLLGLLPAAARAASAVEPTPEAALAWHLDAMSSEILGPTKPDAVSRQAAALLDAAAKLDPQEPRFPRLRTLALLHVGDTDSAIKSLIAYRALRPADTVAQVQLIDLYASRMETLDAKTKYLSSLLDNASVNLPPEVRAQLATEVASLLAQKSPDLAAAMATRAVQYYPVPQATRLYYAYVARGQDLPKRIAGLLAVLKSNPNQPVYAAELAELLATNGLAEESLNWYELAVSLPIVAPPNYHNLLVAYASEFVVAGHPLSAGALAGQMLERSPLDADGWFLRLTVDMNASDQAFAQTLDAARTAFTRRWNAFHEEFLTGQAATQPAAAPAAPGETQEKVEPLDAAPVLQKIKDGSNAAATDAFVSVVSDIAWFELFFDRKPELAARWVEYLRAVLPADSRILQRLEGWNALDTGRFDQARDLLSKNAKTDALSELGLLRADAAEKKPVDAKRIEALLDENRVGLVAAMLWSSFKSEVNRPTTRPAAMPVMDELRQFPRDLLSVLNPQTASRVYTLRAELVQAHVPFGAPVLAQVTLDNTSGFDLSIGPDALIRPDLWFNARTLGLDQQSYPGAAYDDLQNQIVLRGRHSVTQTVRLDQPRLRQPLMLSPGSSTLVDCTVSTNPLPMRDPATGQEVAVPGPGGMLVNFIRTFTYSGMPLTLATGRQDLQRAIASGSPVDKIHAADLIVAFIRLGRGPSADETLRKATEDLPGQLAGLRADKSPLVSGWATYLAGELADGSEREKIAGEMAGSPQWTTRMLALFLGGPIAPERQKELATKLSGDGEPSVKAAAAATLEALAQSTTQPAEGAATQPVAP